MCLGFPKAREKWVKHVRDDSKYAEVIEGLERWKQTTQWQDRQYIPYTETFLSKERWKDEITLTEVANGKVGLGSAPRKAESKDRANVGAVETALRRRASRGGMVGEVLPQLPERVDG